MDVKMRILELVKKHPLFRNKEGVTIISFSNNFFPRQHFLDIYKIRLSLLKGIYDTNKPHVSDKSGKRDILIKDTEKKISEIETFIKNIAGDCSQMIGIVGIEINSKKYALFIDKELTKLVAALE